MKALRCLTYGLVSVVLSFVSIIFGSAPLFALWRSAGKLPFVVTTFGLSALLCAIAPAAIWIPFVTIVILTYYFLELEKMGLSLRLAGALSVISTAVVLGIGFLVWMKKQNMDPGVFLKTQAQTILAEVVKRQPQFKMDIDLLIGQIPSVAIIALITTLWFGLVFERRFRGLVGSGFEQKDSNTLTNFKVPNALIWPAISSIALAFIEMGLASTYKIIALNIFNVFVFVYFLQGLAIVATVFKVFRVGFFWQALSYVVLAVQLLPVSFLGLLDFWFDFRARFGRKSPETV